MRTESCKEPWPSIAYTLKPVLLGALLFPAISWLALRSANAATVIVYTNDFESYSAVASSLADEATDADPTGVEWNVADDNPLGSANGSGVQVIDWLTNSVGAPTKSLLVRPNSEAQVYFRGARSGSRYQLDFRVQIARGATSSQSFYVILRGEGSDINGDDFLAYRTDRLTNSSALYSYDGVGPGAGAWAAVGTNHLNNVWQRHRMVINANELTYDLYIDDMVTPFLTGVELARSEVGVPTIIRIFNEGNSADDGYFVIDDFSLTVEDSRDLTTTITEGFESYPARVNPDDDADPQGPWVTTEIDGTGQGRLRAPVKVQVVDASVIAPHSGSKSLKLEAGQRAGSTIAWGVPPQSDVQITWWARVPVSVDGQTANYLRMSLYGAENGNTVAGDNALLGYGSRDATIGDDTSLTYFTTAWVDSGIDYTPDVWEEYRLITHTSQGRYTIIKGPSSANPQIIADRLPMIGTATDWSPVFMAAWSSSNGTNHPPVYVDDIEIKSLVSNPDPLPTPYSVQFHGNRFTNVTILQVNGTVGKAVVDPRDNATILFALDVTPPAGGIYRAQKVASGNWSIDPTPIVGGLDRPSGLAIQTNGTIWWTHDFNNDFTRSLGRLKWPWASNSPETIIADVNDPLATTRDDDAIDVTVAPLSFTGSVGQPGWVVVADRGVDGDPNNAVYAVDPTTTTLDQVGYNNFLVNPTAADLGNNLNAIAPLPASGEIMTLSDDGTLVAVDANGSRRYINALNLWPLTGPNSAAAVAADPITGKIWGADDLKDELWSIDASSGADQREISFPLTNPSRTDQQLDIHDPGLSFASDGALMVLSDTSVANGGGRLIIFHNETIALPDFTISGVARVAQGVQLSWQSAGGAKYDVQRGTDVANTASFQNIATNLTTTQFTDTNAPATGAFYRVIAKP